MRYDVIIVGAGPAGLSAAITLKNRNKEILVIGNTDISEKVSKAHEITNYLGIPAVKGADLAEKFVQHAKSMGVEIVNHQLYTVYSMGEYFSLQTTSNETFEAKSVIIATGVNFGKPYAGENEFLGRGVSYCATCDAPFYKGKKIVIIGATKKEEHEADFMSEICSEVIYVPLYNEETEVNSKVQVVRGVPKEIKGGFKADTLVLDNQEIKADGIFILRDNVPPSQLVPGLKLDGNHIEVNRKMETNIPGCLACGDIVGTPYQYIKSAGEGNIAAISAVEYLNSKA